MNVVSGKAKICTIFKSKNTKSFLFIENIEPIIPSKGFPYIVRKPTALRGPNINSKLS
ncbi:hypothetical protein HV819_09250 [Anaerococcus sp. AGMB00486]|uniref:Uncharacterized protein n=1 Tax=Anaerococcus faecalis TaxID=2742993 RepID=A0ABX2NBN9_9FIRM|nr:hypothetical protein [Anaerococcus porci]NVF12140.1 hypothetical protein [Anaerococcus faecalis]